MIDRQCSFLQNVNVYVQMIQAVLRTKISNKNSLQFTFRKQKERKQHIYTSNLYLYFVHAFNIYSSVFE